MTVPTAQTPQKGSLPNAMRAPQRVPPVLPFALSFVFVPLIVVAATKGGWWVALPIVWAVVIVSALDLLLGTDERNPDPNVPEAQLRWHRVLTMAWVPVQLALIFGTLAWVRGQAQLGPFEQIVLFYGIGLASGAIGITYAHEMMHQNSRLERWLADVLMASVLYSHFRSEHLRVHHPWVGTPRDPVTARYNESFWRFFLRVLRSCPRSAWRAERALLARAGRPWWHVSNPFWRYGLLQLGFLALAFGLGGWPGLLLFVWQALVAVFYLELTNYVEHYGLVRRHLGEGRYEPVGPQHSWNAAHRLTNWLLINLQRHSDHHVRPDRRFPLLQTYGPEQAPQLPAGYATMLLIAAIPPLWRRLMNPRVQDWRRKFYPDITDWSQYKTLATPLPRGASAP